MKQFYLNQFVFEEDLKNNPDLELPEIPQGTVLGKRAEYYFQFLIDHSSNYESLVSNLQIFKDKRTIGEIDFIMRNVLNDKTYHIELVYKFYIYDPSVIHKPQFFLNDPVEQELSRYVGPNRRDNLLLKLQRLRKHQIPLLHQSETKSVLELLHIDTQHVEQRVCFLAKIFIPRSLWSHNYTYVNKQCIAGYYMDYDAFAKAETQNIYVLPYKPEWKMEPYYHEKNAQSFYEVLPLVAARLKSGYASLLWMLNQNGSWEVFFVIGNSKC